MIRNTRLKVLFFLGAITLATLAVKYVSMINTVSSHKADRAMRNDAMGKRFRHDLKSDLDLKASALDEKASLRSLLKDDGDYSEDEDEDVDKKVVAKKSKKEQLDAKLNKVQKGQRVKDKSADAKSGKNKPDKSSSKIDDTDNDDSKPIIKETEKKKSNVADSNSKVENKLLDKKNITVDSNKVKRKDDVVINNMKFEKTLVKKNESTIEKNVAKEIKSLNNTKSKEPVEEADLDQEEQEDEEETSDQDTNESNQSVNKIVDNKPLKVEEPKKVENQDSKKSDLEAKEKTSNKTADIKKNEEKIQNEENQDSEKEKLNNDQENEEGEEEESDQVDDKEPEKIPLKEDELVEKKENDQDSEKIAKKSVRSLNKTNDDKPLKNEDSKKTPVENKIISIVKTVNQTKEERKPIVIKLEKVNSYAKRNKSNVVLKVENNKRISNVKLANATPEWISNLERIVHIDLKGAPPKPSYFKTFIPMLKKLGATGILIEYEDTFPFEGQLAEAKYGFAYTKEDIDMIKKLAKENGLKLIPLVQTYGHLEWFLKLKKFAHLREESQYPQVITPCIEESYTVLYDMLDQVIKAHNDAEYFHIGCDEVYYKLTNPKCSDFPTKDFSKAFMGHLIKIATYVKGKLPQTKILFWDDMMHGMPEKVLETYKTDINRLKIKPMMWGYMPRVEAYFPSQYYDKYGRIFGSIWIASAYKGAQGELATATKMAERLANHVSWVKVMSNKVSDGILKFEGVALTGWSRYDHFLPICELLPQAIPHMALALQVLKSGGELDDSEKLSVENKLGCNGRIRISYSDSPSSPGVRCNFPGHEIYELVNKFESLVDVLDAHMKFSDKFMTPINIAYNFHHKRRSHEVEIKLKPVYSSMLDFKKKFADACEPIYWNDTATEWLKVYLEPHLDKIYKVLNAIRNESSRNFWPPRPLPIKLKNYPKNV